MFLILQYETFNSWFSSPTPPIFAFFIVQYRQFLVLTCPTRPPLFCFVFKLYNTFSSWFISAPIPTRFFCLFFYKSHSTINSWFTSARPPPSNALFIIVQYLQVLVHIAASHPLPHFCNCTIPSYLGSQPPNPSPSRPPNQPPPFL